MEKMSHMLENDRIGNKVLKLANGQLRSTVYVIDHNGAFL